MRNIDALRQTDLAQKILDHAIAHLRSAYAQDEIDFFFKRSTNVSAKADWDAIIIMSSLHTLLPRTTKRDWQYSEFIQ